MSIRPAQQSRGIPRDTLLVAAAALFARRGYRATTLDHIANELGVKKASLYHYISSKDDLLLEIYRRLFDRIHAAVEPLATLDLPADERFRRMVHAHLEVVIDHGPAGRRLPGGVGASAAAQRGIRRRKRHHEASSRPCSRRDSATACSAQGSARLMVLALLGMCNWLYQWYQRADRHSPER